MLFRSSLSLSLCLSVSGELCGQVFGISSVTVTIIALIPLILLSWIRSFQELTVFTIIGLLSLIASVVIMLIDGYQNTTISVIKKTPLFSPLNSSLDFLGTATFCYTIHYCVLAIGAEGLKCIKKENILYNANIRIIKDKKKSNLFNISNIMNYSNFSHLFFYKSVWNVDNVIDVDNINIIENIIDNNTNRMNKNNYNKRHDIESNNKMEKYDNNNNNNDNNNNHEINLYEIDSFNSVEINCLKTSSESNNKKQEILKINNSSMNQSVKNVIGKKKMKIAEIVEESRDSDSEDCIQIISNDNNGNYISNNCSNNNDVQDYDVDSTIDKILINNSYKDTSNNITNHHNEINNTERQIFNVITDISQPLRVSFGLTCFLNISMGGAGFAFYRLSAVVK